MSRSCFVALCGALCVAFIHPARAESIVEAIAKITPYDLAGERSLRAIAALDPERAASEREQRELSFVRLMALSDLWLIGAIEDSAPLQQGVARLLGVAPEQASKALATQLAALERGVLGESVRDARQAITLLSAGAPPRILAAQAGPRARMIHLDAVIDAIAQPGPDAVGALAALAVDPCPGASDCSALFAPFAASGRRAVSALVLASASLKRLQQQARDPWIQALLPRLARHRAALSEVELAPMPRLPIAVEPIEEAPATPTSPDLVVLVKEGAVSFGLVPRVRVSEGEVVLASLPGKPSLPALETVTITGELSTFLRSLSPLVAPLRDVQAVHPSGLVAIGAEQKVPAHLWGRALLSARAAGFERLALLGADANQEARLVEIEVVTALGADKLDRKDISLMVRQGGFSLKRRLGKSLSIPRIREEGGFAFDYASLEASLKSKSHSAKLTFMPQVSAGTLTRSAFLIAPSSRALTVVLP